MNFLTRLLFEERKRNKALLYQYEVLTQLVRDHLREISRPAEKRDVLLLEADRERMKFLLDKIEKLTPPK